jgi:hypothetical protein
MPFGAVSETLTAAPNPSKRTVAGVIGTVAGIVCAVVSVSLTTSE